MFIIAIIILIFNLASSTVYLWLCITITHCIGLHMNRCLTSLYLSGTAGQDLKQIIDDSQAEVSSNSSNYWVMVAALKVGNLEPTCFLVVSCIRLLPLDVVHPAIICVKGLVNDALRIVFLYGILTVLALGISWGNKNWAC